MTDAQHEDLLTNKVDQLEHLTQNLAGVSARLIALEIFRSSNKSNQRDGMMVHIDHPLREKKKEYMFKGMVVAPFTNLIVNMNLSM